MREKFGATVTAVLAGGLVNLKAGASIPTDPSSGNVPNVPYPPGYAPQVGDLVVVDYLIDTPYIAAVLTPNRTTPSSGVSVVNTNPGGLTQISTVLTDSATPPNLTLVRTTAVTPGNSLTVLAKQSGTYDPTNSWRTDDNKVRQGDFGTGANSGLWFYGSGAFAALAGHTVTGIQMTVIRDTSAGYSWGPMQLHCQLHTYATPPAGAPTFTASYDPAGATPSLGQTVTFALPVGWGQALQSGSAAGIGIYSSLHTDYVVNLGVNKSSPTSGQLVISYT